MAEAVSKQGDQYNSFLDLTRTLLAHKWVIVGPTIVFMLLGIVHGAIATKIYRAEIVLVYQEQDQGDSRLGGLAQQFGALASFTGLKLNASSNSREEALATLRSRGFGESYIADKQLLPVLFSGKWDADRNDWDVDDAEDIPTLQDGFNKFRRRVLSVTEDLNTGLVTLGVEWRDPDLAAQWANDLVARVNHQLQERAIAEANISMAYLTKELEKASYVELRSAIFDLIEGQFHTIMLANVRDEYAFRIVDPAKPSDADNYHKPNRILIAIAGTMFGFFVGIFLVLFRSFVKHIRES